MTGIKIERPDAERLKELGTESWYSWECEPSEFWWEFGVTEIAYIQDGKATVTPSGGVGGDTPAVDIKPGDLVTFPEGMECTWDIKEKIKKVYTIED